MSAQLIEVEVIALNRMSNGSDVFIHTKQHELRDRDEYWPEETGSEAKAKARGESSGESSEYCLRVCMRASLTVRKWD